MSSRSPISLYFSTSPFCLGSSSSESWGSDKLYFAAMASIASPSFIFRRGRRSLTSFETDVTSGKFGDSNLKYICIKSLKYCILPTCSVANWDLQQQIVDTPKLHDSVVPNQHQIREYFVESHSHCEDNQKVIQYPWELQSFDKVAMRYIQVLRPALYRQIVQ